MKKAISFIFFLICKLSFSYLQIYPLDFDKRIDKGGEVVEFTFSNPTSEKLRYLIQIDKGEENWDMSPWAEYYPRSISLNPGEEKDLKVYINAPKGSKKGKYTAILGIKELPIAKSEDMKKSKGRVSLLADIKLEIAGFVGEKAKK